MDLALNVVDEFMCKYPNSNNHDQILEHILNVTGREDWLINLLNEAIQLRLSQIQLRNSLPIETKPNNNGISKH